MLLGALDDILNKGPKVETQHHSRSNRVSLFHWNTRDISRSRFAGETRARNVTCIPMEKARRDLNASDAFLR